MNPDDQPAAPALAQTGFPLNRILVLLGPYLATLSGGVAAWLSQHFPGLNDDLPQLTEGITQGATFIVAGAITWALQHKYLEGWQQWEGGLLALEAAKQGVPAARVDPLSALTSQQPSPQPAAVAPARRAPARAPAPPARQARRGAQGFGRPAPAEPFDVLEPALFTPGSGRAGDG